MNEEKREGYPEDYDRRAPYFSSLLFAGAYGFCILLVVWHARGLSDPLFLITFLVYCFCLLLFIATREYHG